MTYQQSGIPCPTEHRELIRTLLTGIATPEVRLAWCESIRKVLQENRDSLRPVRVEKWAFPKPVDLNLVSTDADTQTRIRAREGQMRLADARDESARRLRATLQCEAWMRGIDVTNVLVDNLSLWHEQEWGITAPVSDRYWEREAMLLEAVAAKVR